jgi:hypothetical protein
MSDSHFCYPISPNSTARQAAVTDDRLAFQPLKRDALRACCHCWLCHSLAMGSPNAPGGLYAALKALPCRLRSCKGTLLVVLAVLVVTGGIELAMGRSPLGPDGKFGWWEGNIWSGENSQRLADPYSFSHIGHGILFFGLFWLVRRNLPVRYGLWVALLLEASWELLENSPLIINRYREATIALGYVGDSVMNSLSDVLMMALGFLFAVWARPWMSVALLVVMEVGCALCVRDNLTLNVIMLIHPVEAIKTWQMVGRPL